MDYKTSGVDIEAGRKFVSQIKQTVEDTHTANVVGGLGGFGGLFKLPIKDYANPILVSGTDGVGTKLEIAQQKGFHYEVGIDLVAMCINDIVTTGAIPLFFLDYIATGKLEEGQLLKVVQGISKACKENNCSLLGGETAEMPGFYSKNKYDLAGFCVGIVEESKLINGKRIAENDVIIGLQSNGIHSNGFSLIRKIIENSEYIDQKFEEVTNLNFYSQLMRPTKIYSELIRQLFLEKIEIKGMAHITGGGLPENLPRSIPKTLVPYIDKKSWDIPFIFQFLKDIGQIPEDDYLNTFNLGVGFCLICDKKNVNKILNICLGKNVIAWELGKLIARNDLNSQQIIAGI